MNAVKNKQMNPEMHTEIIPHKPQNRWFARVYFSASQANFSTSLSLGWLPIHRDGESQYIRFEKHTSFKDKNPTKNR